MGTVGYMSPEQVRGAERHRSDIFSFGVILYELLSAAAHFKRDCRGNHDRDPQARVAGAADTAPPGVRQIVHHCLEKDPGNRFSRRAISRSRWQRCRKAAARAALPKVARNAAMAPLDAGAAGAVA